MKNIIKTIAAFGAQTIVTLISKDVKALEREANFLFNFGAANKVPDDFELESGKVVIPCTTTNFHAALSGMARKDLANQSKRLKRKDASKTSINRAVYNYNYHTALKKRAEETLHSFIQTEPYKTNSCAVSSVSVHFGEQV